MTKQLINIGTSANDGTGTDLRTAMDMINDNFSELYGRGSPIAGSNEGIINACKYFEFNVLYKGDLFYIGLIVAGTFASPNYTYTVEVWRTSTLASVGEKVMSYTYTGITQQTGLKLITLAEYDGSGYSGKMVINWSALTLGSTYQGDDWSEGGIFAFTVVPSGKSIGDELIDVVTANETVVDGSRELYILNPIAPIDVKACAYADIKGVINLKNISASTVIFAGNSTETFDAVAATVQIAEGESVSITPYNGNFILQGTYTLITP